MAHLSATGSPRSPVDPLTSPSPTSWRTSAPAAPAATTRPSWRTWPATCARSGPTSCAPRARRSGPASSAGGRRRRARRVPGLADPPAGAAAARGGGGRRGVRSRRRGRRHPGRARAASDRHPGPGRQHGPGAPARRDGRGHRPSWCATHDALQLRVHAALGASPDGDHHEVWLINGDGRRMYALGVLPSSGDASYWLPRRRAARAGRLRDRRHLRRARRRRHRHSQHSLVRGDAARLTPLRARHQRRGIDRPSPRGTRVRSMILVTGASGNVGGRWSTSSSRPGSRCGR